MSHPPEVTAWASYVALLGDPSRLSVNAVLRLVVPSATADQ